MLHNCTERSAILYFTFRTHFRLHRHSWHVLQILQTCLHFHFHMFHFYFHMYPYAYMFICIVCIVRTGGDHFMDLTLSMSS